MSQYIKPITSDQDLIDLAKHLGVRLNGVLEISEIKGSLPKKGTYIILLRADGGTGHWVAYNDGHYFDSRSVGPPSILGDLPYSERQYQGTYSDYCGPFCVLWLYAQQHNRPELLKGFNDLDVDAI